MESTKQKVVIIGAGRTGRGMLGEMFYSEGDYQITFADNNSDLVAGLRDQGWYGIEQKDLISGEVKVTIVQGFQVLDTINQHEVYIEAIAHADFVATALFPDAFDKVAADLSEAVARRMKLGLEKPTVFLLGANFVGLVDYFYPRILKGLNKKEKEHFKRFISLVGTNANRKVVSCDESHDDKYCLTGDNKKTLMVDNSLKENIDRVPSFFKLTDNLEAFMAEKIWSANLEHCSFGFLGGYERYETINQAVKDDRIRKMTYYAWLEGRRAIEIEYGFPIPSDEKKQIDYQKFSSPYFADKISRIARDPIRKLAKNDRFIGPALLCLRHNIMPSFILKCAAYGFFYIELNDPVSVRLQKMMRVKSLEEVILEVCQLDPSIHNENVVYQILLANCREISPGCPISLGRS